MASLYLRKLFKEKCTLFPHFHAIEQIVKPTAEGLCYRLYPPIGPQIRAHMFHQLPF